MRKTHTCPKCQGKRLWRIEKVNHDNTYAGGAHLRVAYERAIGAAKTGLGATGRPSVKSVGHFDLFVCRGCGYSEWYARDLEGLAHNPAAGVFEIDASVGGG